MFMRVIEMGCRVSNAHFRDCVASFTVNFYLLGKIGLSKKCRPGLDTRLLKQ